MQEKTLHMWRVTASGKEVTPKHFRIAAPTAKLAEEKVKMHLWDAPVENITVVAGALGTVTFWE